MLGSVSISAYQWPLDGINICQMIVYAIWQLSCVHFYIQLLQKRITIQINFWRNTFLQRKSTYICGFLTSSILINQVNNYIKGVILRIACFDFYCPLFTFLDFWHILTALKTACNYLKIACLYLVFPNIPPKHFKCQIIVLRAEAQNIR